MQTSSKETVHDAFVPGWETAGAKREAGAALQANPHLDAFLVMWDTGAQAGIQVLKSPDPEPGKCMPQELTERLLAWLPSTRGGKASRLGLRSTRWREMRWISLMIWARTFPHLFQV